MLETILQDLHYAIRRLGGNPGFATVAVLTLALGIGANLAMFTVVNAVLLRQLPYKEPNRLMIIWNHYGDAGQKLPRVSFPDFADYKQQSQTFEQFAGAIESTVALTGFGEPEQVDHAIVSPNFFSVLGVSMQLGRDLEPNDSLRDRADVVILSDRLWKRRYGGDPKLLGQTIQSNGNSLTVVGILPPDFKWYCPPEVRVKDSDLWTPGNFEPENNSRTSNVLTVIGRLKPGVSLQQAQSDMDGIANRLREEHIEHKTSGIRIKVVPLQDDIVKRIRPTLIILFAAVCFVLLIACANLANLTLTRAMGREREVAIRLALGANRPRIIRQMLTESILLSVLGGGAGLLLAYFGISLLVSLQPANLPRLDSVAIDYRVFVFCTGLCVLTPMLFGLAPALHASRANLAEVLKRGSRGSNSGGHRLRNLLVVIEIALSLVLLIGGGLLVRTFVSLQRVHLGYDPDNVLTFRISLPFTRYRAFGRDKNVEFFRQLEARISNISGVEAAGGSAQLPLAQGGYQTGYAYDEESEQRLASFSADWRWVTPGYFNAMGARLIAGRFFTEQDGLDSPPVVVVDDLMARKIWPNESAIGKRIKDEGPDRRWKEVVGVVEHMLNNSLTAEVREQIYISQRQQATNALYFTVRTRSSSAGVLKSIEDEVHKLDADLAVHNVRPMNDYVKEATAQTRYSLILIGLLAAAAMALAAVGLYGVISYSVNQRSQEIGIRVALGGQQRDILKLIMSHGLTLTSIGIGTGLVAAVFLTRLMSGLLFGVSPDDPVTFAGISVLLAIVAMLACYLPARRATRVDPMIALRYE